MCTDDAPAMLSENEGLVAHFKQETKDPNVLISFHCILDQQNI